MNPTLVRIAMASAGVMLAHQVAAKAFRDATFLTDWPATALPLMTVATAVLSGALTPLVSRSFERYTPLRVVIVGFIVSAAGHIAEWALYDIGRWIAVVIYLHLSGVVALLLSGFWSLIAERFDPQGARSAYGRIAAAGTAGGIAGSAAAERIATTLAPGDVLLFLAALHLLSAGGVMLMRRAPAVLPRVADQGDRATVRDVFRAPCVRAIASFVVLTSACSAVVDFLLKANAQDTFGSGPALLRFFAVFYGGVQVLSFLAQTRSGYVLQRFGVGASLNSLPAGVGAAGIIALLAPGWPAFPALRLLDAVLRNSLFRSGYELLFVPMDARTRSRTKAILDVICDRAGEAAGSALVQVVLLLAIASTTNVLLVVAIALAAVALQMGQRFSRLYVDVIEHELVKYRVTPQVSLISETGWTLLQVPRERVASVEAEAPPTTPTPPAPSSHLDADVQRLMDLRSKDTARVRAARVRPATLGRLHIAQIIDLLAWDDVLPAARSALEETAAAHAGMFVDVLWIRQPTLS